MNAAKIAILTIGDELLNGERADTNTRRIAESFADVGLTIRESVSVLDNEPDIIFALLRLTERYDLLIVTGGLGSTADDMTARAAAEAFGLPLDLNEDAMKRIREFFTRRQRSMHQGNEKQALLPRKSVIIPNAQGTASGFSLKYAGCLCFFLPGVPSEMTSMLKKSVLPQLTSDQPPLLLKRLHIFGIPEPEVEERLSLLPLPTAIRIAFGVDYPFVTVKLKAEATANQELAEAESTIRAALGDFVVAIDDESLVTVVSGLLRSSGKKLALAESCTGGLIAKLLTDQSGASAFFERSAVTYANTAKRDWLGVSHRILDCEGAVSEECARNMALGIRRSAATDFGLAVTGIAGPDGGTEEKPVGTVYIALATSDGETARRYQFTGDRDQVRLMTACMALEWLRRYLSQSTSILTATEEDGAREG